MKSPLSTSLSLLAAIGCWVTCSGCINFHETVYREQNRVPVQFESPEAADTFYEAMNRPEFRNLHSESHFGVHLPLVFDHSRTVKVGENMIFNHAVIAADTNKDQTVSASEAEIFAARY